MINKNYTNTFLFKKTNLYQQNLLDFIMNCERINKDDPSFDDIKFQVKRRQNTNVIYQVLENPNVILAVANKPLPKAFKVFCARDVKTDGNLTIFIDCSEILRNNNGIWYTSAIDKLIAYLISAMTNYIYYTNYKMLVMNNDLTSNGAAAFASLFTNIIDYIYKINIMETKKDNCMYLAAMYYQVNLLGKDPDSQTTKSLAKHISRISDRQMDIVDMNVTEKTYTDINEFIKTVGQVLKIDKLTIDVFMEKWIFIYGTGTQFATEYFPSFASMLSDTYVGCYINNQKTIEKITGNKMVDFTKTLFRIGEAVMK